MNEAILQLKREFVRYVSHEIRSPLNVVHAGLELLQADLIVAGALSSTRSLLKDIYFASSAAIDILNDMLQYEHIDSGTFKLDCTVVSILQAFAGRMDGFRFLLSTKNISLQIEDLAQVTEYFSPDEGARQSGQALQGVASLSPSADPSSTISPSSAAPPSPSLVLFMDKFRVEQIIRNLMTNAVKFSPEGGNVTIRFRINSSDDQHQDQHQQRHMGNLSPETVAGLSSETLTITNSFLRIEIQDSGVGEILYLLVHILVLSTYIRFYLLRNIYAVGIAVEDQAKIFQQFAQFNRNQLQGGGGSGLGLWICRNLATFHGGRMV